MGQWIPCDVRLPGADKQVRFRWDDQETEWTGDVIKELKDIDPEYFFRLLWFDESVSPNQELQKELEGISSNLEKLNQHTWQTYKEQIKLHLNTCFEILNEKNK